MSFRYDAFIKNIHTKHKDAFTLDQIKDILFVDEYLKDSPMSTGQRLIVDSLLFRGVKSDETEFFFSHKFQSGVNVLIADNLKGKSSVFKIIRFALTGKNVDNIGQWIKEVLLSFKVNNNFYSTYIDCSSHRLKAKLLKGNILRYEDIENADLFWEVSSKEDYILKMQEFFFSQFSYYSLKWTQKPSQKDKVELQENATSWKTYFHSIFLESKDSYELSFGNQEIKTFEMLFGLELTYPINSLTVKLDKLKSEKGINADHITRKINADEKQKKKIEEELILKNKEYNQAVKPVQKKIIDTKSLYDHYQSLTQKLNNENERLILMRKELQTIEEDEEKIEIQRKALKSKIGSLKKENQQKLKRINDLNEYKDSLSFFSNLDIKHCPNCDHPVSPDKMKMQANEHKCSLCSEDVHSKDETETQENILTRVNDLTENVNQLNTLISDLEFEYSNYSGILEPLINKKKQINVKPNFDLNYLSQEISNSEKQIKNALVNNKTEIPTPNLSILLKEIAVLEYKKLELKNQEQAKIDTSSYDKQIELLDNAIFDLKHMRYSIGNSSINKLEEIILSKIHSFGIKNISKIKITEGLGIRYIQDGVQKEFKNLVEGEQLRAKISLYLSLIELDIFEQLGKHSHFLIIDSPAKEEGDKYYLAGLISELQNIDKTMHADLQILIGTAERDFENKFKNQLIFEDGQFVF
ncbi:hypothetical protein [Dysgonomonas sp. ZJ709]|uniref:hypothetical protein n=1 Tax=Dysgonomonas sp. ZJ709 TaxID=2709797 RepID=UPI0013EAA4D7|nr:hypothetical protein [Dysgonomonas sp. ZJ709]